MKVSIQSFYSPILCTLYRELHPAIVHLPLRLSCGSYMGCYLEWYRHTEEIRDDFGKATSCNSETSKLQFRVKTLKVRTILPDVL